MYSFNSYNKCYLQASWLQIIQFTPIDLSRKGLIREYYILMISQKGRESGMDVLLSKDHGQETLLLTLWAPSGRESLTCHLTSVELRPEARNAMLPASEDPQVTAT